MNYHNVPSIRINHSDYLRKLSKLTDHAFKIFIDNFHGNVMLKIIYCLWSSKHNIFVRSKLISIDHYYWVGQQTKTYIHVPLISVNYLLQVENFTWIQCDNVNCQKWRKIPANEGDHYDNVDWFCYMNSDPEYNR